MKKITFFLFAAFFVFPYCIAEKPKIGSETKEILFSNGFDKTKGEYFWCLLTGKCKLSERRMKIIGADHGFGHEPFPLMTTLELEHVGCEYDKDNKSFIAHRPEFLDKHGRKHEQLEKIQAFLDGRYEELTNKDHYHTAWQVITEFFG